MQVYYFTRTGRSRAIADEIAERYNTEARKIEDHKNWDGKLNYIKAGFMACRGKAIAADYVEPDMTDDITAVVTSLGSKLKNRDGFRRISPHLNSPQLYFE